MGANTELGKRCIWQCQIICLTRDGGLAILNLLLHYLYKRVTNMVSDVVRQFIVLLRYFIGSAIAIVVVWSVDIGHDIVKKGLEAAWPWNTSPSIWLLVGFLGVIGVTVYFAHRILFHPTVTEILVEIHAERMGKAKPSIDELAFARWRRRGAAIHSTEKSAQVVLDEANASAHLFYCAGWSIFLIAIFFKLVFPGYFQIAVSAGTFFLIVGAFMLIGIFADWRTARLDLEAYYRFNHKDIDK